ncbi:hypothetical protein [Archaeoglobus sp.]
MLHFYSCVVVASGGTERKILEAVKKPVVVWALPYYNFLPAVLEAYAVKKFKFFYSDVNRMGKTVVLSHMES